MNIYLTIDYELLKKRMKMVNLKSLQLVLVNLILFITF